MAPTHYRTCFLNNSADFPSNRHSVIAKVSRKASLGPIDRILLMAFGRTRDEAYNVVTTELENLQGAYEIDSLEST